MGKVKIIDGKLVNYLPDKSYILKTKPHPLCSLKNNLAFWNHKKMVCESGNRNQGDQSGDRGNGRDLQTRLT